MIRKTMRNLSLSILNNPLLNEKIHSGIKIGELAALISGDEYDEKAYERLASQIKVPEGFLSEIPLTPARPSDWEYSSEEKKSLNFKERLYSILNTTYIDIEISAMEASAVLLVLADDMPLSFYKDFGSHLSDEARHAQLIHQLCLSLPDFTFQKKYSNKIWNKVSQGQNILEKIMIENVIEEGSAADRTVRFIQELKDEGYPEIADLFSTLNEDEIRHTQIGNKWCNYLLSDNEDQFFEHYDRLVEKHNPDAKLIESIKTRSACGFSNSFIKRYF